MKKYETSRLTPLTESELELVSGGVSDVTRDAAAAVDKGICEALTGGLGGEFCGGSVAIAGKIHDYLSHYHSTNQKSRDYSSGSASAARHPSSNHRSHTHHHESH